MIYNEHVLPPDTAGFGICMWRFAVEAHDPPHFTHAIPPDGTVNLTLAMSPVYPQRFTITGPSARAHLIPAVHGLQVAGVRLRAGAAPLIVRQSAVDFVDRLLPLQPDTPALARLGEALAAYARSDSASGEVAAAFTALCSDLPPVDPLVAQLAERLRADPFTTDIGAVSDGMPLGERQIRRRFRAATGLPPKTFAGIQRLRNAALIALTTPAANWADVAAEAGFADQAHFNRDVARCFGVTPTALLAYLGTIRHALV